MFMATTEELSLLRMADISYRLRRLHALHPRIIPAELLTTLETRVQCEDYVGARLLGEERLKSLGVPFDYPATRSPSGFNENNDISSYDASPGDSHYGGGSPSGGKGASW